MTERGEPGIDEQLPSEESLGLPKVDWQKAAVGARLGDYEPAPWVKNFEEWPELEKIPDAAKPEDVVLVHFRDRIAIDDPLDRLTSLPAKGEIAASLMTKDLAKGGPVALSLCLAKEQSKKCTLPTSVQHPDIKGCLKEQGEELVLLTGRSCVSCNVKAG